MVLSYWLATSLSMATSFASELFCPSIVITFFNIIILSFAVKDRPGHYAPILICFTMNVPTFLLFYGTLSQMSARIPSFPWRAVDSHQLPTDGLAPLPVPSASRPARSNRTEAISIDCQEARPDQSPAWI